jgi:hypothetical protein
MAKLLQQHFHFSLAHGCYGRIPSPLFAMTTRKNNKNIERPQCMRKNAKRQTHHQMFTC